MMGEMTKGRTDAEFVEAMRYLLYEHEPEAEEEVDAYLRSEGIDPEAVAERGRELAARFFASHQSPFISVPCKTSGDTVSISVDDIPKGDYDYMLVTNGGEVLAKGHATIIEEPRGESADMVGGNT